MLPPHPQKPSTTVFLLWMLLTERYSKNRVVAGVKRVERVRRISGSGYHRNECLLTALHSWGVRTDPSQFQEESLLLRRSLWCWKDSASRVSRSELLRVRREGASDQGRSGSCLLAHSRPLPPGNRLPHHLSSGTTCCFSCMATTTAWDKTVSKEGRQPGHVTKNNINYND